MFLLMLSNMMQSDELSVKNLCRQGYYAGYKSQDFERCLDFSSSVFKKLQTQKNSDSYSNRISNLAFTCCLLGIADKLAGKEPDYTRYIDIILRYSQNVEK